MILKNKMAKEIPFFV